MLENCLNNNTNQLNLDLLCDKLSKDVVWTYFVPMLADIFDACKYGWLNIVQYYVEQHSLTNDEMDINKKYALLEIAISNKNDDIVEYLVCNLNFYNQNQYEHIFTISCLYGNLSMCIRCVNEHQFSKGLIACCLNVAKINGHHNIVNYLSEWT